MKEEMTQGMEAPRPEVYHTISCTPGLRDKSLEVRRFLSTAINRLSFVIGTPGGMLSTKPGRHEGAPQAS